MRHTFDEVVVIALIPSLTILPEARSHDSSICSIIRSLISGYTLMISIRSLKVIRWTWVRTLASKLT